MEDKNRYMETNPDDALIQQNRRGVKLDSSRSQFVQKAQSEEDFAKKVDQYNTEQVNKNQRASELAKDFLEIIRSKDLQRNKGPLSKNREKEVFDNLIAYARELNNDIKLKEDSYGSMAVIILLMKTVVYQRDLYNELEYRLAETEKQLKKMSSASKSDDIKK